MNKSRNNRNPARSGRQSPERRKNASVQVRAGAETAEKNKIYVQGASSGGFRGRKQKVEVVRYREGVDRIFLIVVLLLLSIGTVMVFSSSYANGLYNYGDSYFFAKKQVLMVALALAGMAATTYLGDYRLIYRVSAVFFAGVLVLNYLTPFIGKVANGTPRWIRIGSMQLQPSELLKTAIVFLFAYYVVKTGEKMKTFTYGIFFPALVIVLVTGAMILQSHFSGLIIIALIALSLIFIGEAPMQWLGGFAGVGAAGVYTIITFTDYANSRIAAWRDPFADSAGDGYQIIQSLLAIGSGGLFGVGIGNSKQKFLYLPEPQNDFIFSIYCEETGFIGAIIVIILYIILIWRGFVIAFHAPDKFSSLVVMGLTIKVAIQFVLNIAVVTNTIPTTGISLPFFSYGGTALIVQMVEMGIILAISRYSYQDKA